MPEVGWVKFIDKVKPSILMAGLSANGYEAMNLTTRDKLVWENIFEMKEIASNSNMLKPNQRLKFDQLHHGHAVEGAQMAVHLDDSKNVKLVHGYVVKNFTNPEAIVNISPEEAITIALNEINAELYAWEDPGWEQQIKQDLGDSSATHYPKPDLIYINSGNGRNDANYVLTFSVNVHSLKPDSSQKIYVDVLSGRIVRKTNNGKSIRPPSTFLGSNATGTVETLYNGNRSLSTYNRGWPYNDYVLKDFTRGDKIHTLNYSSTAWNLRSEIDDNNNYWETLDVPATLHWTVGASWDYFSNAHGRNGLDNNGSEIRVEANYSGWDLYERKDGRDYIRDGVTENGNHWTSPESTGHEFTHGVIKHAVDFAESGEPLFLEESFCDIFGVMVERSVKGS
ncbi:MAG: hypothetical protein OEW75_18205, partial [Cyclobacteriaceae bacterium]|nr:hypothetical protein [Cyclobacteriaceae bacterium]